MSEARAVRIFLAAAGVCHICERPIRDGEPWDADHRKPLWDGGTDDDSNLAPAHVRCHGGKTGAESGQRAKRNRIITASFAGKKPRGNWPPKGSRKVQWWKPTEARG